MEESGGEDGAKLANGYEAEPKNESKVERKNGFARDNMSGDSKFKGLEE